MFSVLVLAAGVAYRCWPRPLPFPPAGAPGVTISQGRFLVRMPTQVLLAQVSAYPDELTAYLYFDYLRSRREVARSSVLLSVAQQSDSPEYCLLLAVPNDLLQAEPYLGELIRQGYIPGFELQFSNLDDLARRHEQTRRIQAAFHRSVRDPMPDAPASELLYPVSRFVNFKSSVDSRTRLGLQPGLTRLSSSQSDAMAADIIAVAKFYSLPLDFFLGIGAMENNYLDVNGDVGNFTWKRRAEKGDIVLQRRRHKVLVWNYSLGPWQITRETLRHAHQLYLRDRRDYSLLPAHLRPPRGLDLDQVDSAVLTTYAGLLFRDLLDRFDGDVQKAVGAYNGGRRRPNPRYAAGVTAVADYARQILQARASRAEVVSAGQLP